MEQEIAKLYQEYEKVLNSQVFDPDKLDYSILEDYKKLLHKLDQIENSSFEIFDMYKKDHVHFSSIFETMLGFDSGEVLESGLNFFDTRIHPNDLIQMLRIGIYYLKYLFDMPIETKTKKNFKLINDYRLLNGWDEYVRVTKQYTALEFDEDANLWLTLGVINISPNDDVNEPLKTKVIDLSTNKVIILPNEADIHPVECPISDRELEVLEMISKGFSSKQIASNLFISQNTVNTHRQNILKKLDVGNTAEAVSYCIEKRFL